jgi:hypothetical protein
MSVSLGNRGRRRKKMLKAKGVTVKVGPAIRSVVRVSPFVAFVLMAKDGEPHHIAVEAHDAPRFAFTPDGPIWPEGNYSTMGVIWLKGKALEVLRAFLEAHPEGVTLYMSYMSEAPFGEEWQLAFTAHDGLEGYYTRLIIWPWGMAVKESWGQESFYDSWAVDPSTGQARYTGTVEGVRYLPVWLVKALA